MLFTYLNCATPVFVINFAYTAAQFVRVCCPLTIVSLTSLYICACCHQCIQLYTDCQCQRDLFLNLSSLPEIWIMQQGTPSLAIKLKCSL